MKKEWKIVFDDAFAEEFVNFSEEVQDMLLRKVKVVSVFGPQTDRPLVDTLNGSKHRNMKEMRFDADDGVWRVAFAFDPERKGVLLVAGDKSGGSSEKFYKKLIKKADKRFDEHLERLKKG